MRPRFCSLKNEEGSSAVEFAVLLPVWLILFFGLLDYGWYLTNLIVLENAVASGARAGVKTQYWLDENDEDYKNPAEVAQKIVLSSFWLNKTLKANHISATFLDKEQQIIDMDTSEPSYTYFQVRVTDYAFEPLTGYLPEALIPQKIGAFAMTVFP
jgi:Flp pilus assembly protein TadG